MSNVTESMLMAYVDGELNAVENARVEQAVALDPGLRRELAAQRRLKSTLSARYDPVLDENVPERFRAMLTSNVISIVPMPEKQRQGRMQMFAAMAASMVVGLLAAQIGGGRGPISIHNDVVVAKGDLADALQTQLASEQPSGAETRIGVSFVAQSGRLCRTFEAPVISGLACRGPEDWEVVMAIANAQTEKTEYRQAGNGGGAVIGLAQEMMAGEPLDAAAERRARDLGWAKSPSSTRR